MSTSVSGTQSPPLEATGEQEPMGASSVGGGNAGAVPDSEQRKQYFEGTNDAPSKAERAAKEEIEKKTKSTSDESSSLLKEYKM